MNLGRRGGKQVTNRLSYGTGFHFLLNVFANEICIRYFCCRFQVIDLHIYKEYAIELWHPIKSVLHRLCSWF
jgi:hypothetical protein